MTYDLPYLATANCRGIDTDQFFTNGKTYPNMETIQTVCARCNVQADCLDYALHVQVSGYWGGTTEQEREKIREEFGIKPETVGKLFLIGGQSTVWEPTEVTVQYSEEY